MDNIPKNCVQKNRLLPKHLSKTNVISRYAKKYDAINMVYIKKHGIIVVLLLLDDYSFTMVFTSYCVVFKRIQWHYHGKCPKIACVQKNAISWFLMKYHPNAMVHIKKHGIIIALCPI